MTRLEFIIFTIIVAATGFVAGGHLLLAAPPPAREPPPVVRLTTTLEQSKPLADALAPYFDCLEFVVDEQVLQTCEPEE